MRELRDRLQDVLDAIALRIDQEIVWETVETHLPVLKAEIEKIVGSLPTE